MAQQNQRPRVTETESWQEGSRWIGRRPTGEEVAHWFSTIRLDDGLRHEDHVGGITIISARETLTEVRDGRLVDVERMVHVPYPRVDARIAYFWQLCELRDWDGEIEPVAVPRVREPGVYNENLPPGFSKLSVPLPDRRVASYLVCTQRVTMTRGQGRFAKPVRRPSPASKAVPLVDRWSKPDDNAIMKAETGAQGRALGMAGIFVIPGAGVATAEDMQEYLAGTGAGAVAEPAPSLPSDAEPEQDIDERIMDLRRQVAQADQQVAFDEWVQERGFDLANLREGQKRPVVRRLEQLLGG